MEIVRTSPFSGKTNAKKMMIDPADMNRFEARADSIQNIFPYLSPGDREFIKTGITDEEWETMKPNNWTNRIQNKIKQMKDLSILAADNFDLDDFAPLDEKNL